MLNLLELMKAAQLTESWGQVSALFPNRRWIMIPTTGSGRMAYTVLDDNLMSGRMLTLVVMEDCQAPQVGFPVGTTLVGLKGKLRTLDNKPEMVTLVEGDLLTLDGGIHAPGTEGFYIGAWLFPNSNPLLRMVEAGGR